MKRCTLHDDCLSGPSNKVGLMFALTGTPYAYHDVDMAGGENKSPGFLAQIPYVTDDGDGRHYNQSPRSWSCPAFVRAIAFCPSNA